MPCNQIPASFSRRHSLRHLNTFLNPAGFPVWYSFWYDFSLVNTQVSLLTPIVGSVR